MEFRLPAVGERAGVPQGAAGVLGEVGRREDLSDGYRLHCAAFLIVVAVKSSSDGSSPPPNNIPKQRFRYNCPASREPFFTLSPLFRIVAVGRGQNHPTSTLREHPMNTDRLAIIASTLRSLDIPAWLLYSFRDSNPISARMLGLTSAIHQSRRWACLITADGKVRGLAHRIEPHIAELMPGEVEMYSTREEFEHGIARLVRGVGRVAMEYSPNNAIP